VKREAIQEAKEEALRFLRRVKEFENSQGFYYFEDQKFPIATSMESGALRRSSIDLTRALAKMRKS